jgi:putative addiction module component (TIGR02574 family)
MRSLPEVLKEALILDVQDRAALAQELLASLDEVAPEDAERLWAEEAQRRLADFREGRAHASSSEQIAEKVSQRFR